MNYCLVKSAQFFRLHGMNNSKVCQAAREQQSIHKGHRVHCDDEDDYQGPVYKFGTVKTIYIGPMFNVPAGSWCDTPMVRRNNEFNY